MTGENTTDLTVSAHELEFVIVLLCANVGASFKLELQERVIEDVHPPSLVLAYRLPSLRAEHNHPCQVRLQQSPELRQRRLSVQEHAALRAQVHHAGTASVCCGHTDTRDSGGPLITIHATIYGTYQ